MLRVDCGDPGQVLNVIRDIVRRSGIKIMSFSLDLGLCLKILRMVDKIRRHLNWAEIAANHFFLTMCSRSSSLK